MLTVTFLAEMELVRWTYVLLWPRPGATLTAVPAFICSWLAFKSVDADRLKDGRRWSWEKKESTQVVFFEWDERFPLLPPNVNDTVNGIK